MSVGISSGTSVLVPPTVAAIDGWATYTEGGAAITNASARTFMVSGLTAGTNTFALYYRVSSGTGSWDFRNITVQGIA
jgi:hypothetical protein